MENLKVGKSYRIPRYSGVDFVQINAIIADPNLAGMYQVTYSLIEISKHNLSSAFFTALRTDPQSSVMVINDAELLGDNWSEISSAEFADIYTSSHKIQTLGGS